MTRAHCLRLEPGDLPVDSDALLELDDIRTPAAVNDAEPELALGSTLHMLDGARRAEATYVAPPSELETVLIAYLLDLDPPT